MAKYKKSNLGREQRKVCIKIRSDEIIREMKEKEKLSKIPSRENNTQIFEQMERGKELFRSNPNLTPDEVKNLGGDYTYFGYRQEKIQTEAVLKGEKMFLDGKKFEKGELSEIEFKSDFIRKGYYQAFGRSWFDMGKDLYEAPDDLKQNIDFLNGYKNTLNESMKNRNKTK